MTQELLRLIAGVSLFVFLHYEQESRFKEKYNIED